MKIKTGSHKYDIDLGLDIGTNVVNKKCMMMLICIKQDLSYIWSSIYEKVKQHWGWDEKSGHITYQ